MMKQLAASHVAKSVALCVCPVVTAGVIATKEPHVRRMIHKATAPKTPERRRVALAASDLPPCPNPPAFASLPRVSAALPAAVGIPPEEAGLTPTATAANIGTPYPFDGNSPGAVNLQPIFGGIGGGGGGGIGGGGGGTPTFPGGGTSPTSPVSGVPEPETWLQVLGGLALAGGTVRYIRSRKQAATA